MQTYFITPSSSEALKGKWVVLMDLPWLPPGIRENSMDLFGLAAEKVCKERPTQTGIYPLSDFAGKWWYATVAPSPSLWACGSFSTEQIATFISEGRGGLHRSGGGVHLTPRAKPKSI